jgi:hypothetical protein
MTPTPSTTGDEMTEMKEVAALLSASTVEG